MQKTVSRVFSVLMAMTLLVFSFAVAPLAVAAKTIPASNGTAGYAAAPEDVVTIPDPFLRAAIYFAIPKNPADNVTQGELATITELYAGNFDGTKTITDLEGIQYLTGATRIELPLNNITDVSKLAGLTNLEILQLCYNPNLTDLSPLVNLPNLTTFWASYCVISDIRFMENMTFNHPVNINFEHNHIFDITSLGNNPDIDGDGVPVSSAYVNLQHNWLDPAQASVIQAVQQIQARQAFIDISNQDTAGTIPDIFTLAVGAEPAQGSAAASPDYSTRYAGDIVTLTATPESGFTFSSWAGAPVADPNANPTTIEMLDNYTVNATFTADTPTFTLDVMADPTQGSAAKDPDTSTHASGDIVTLIATPLDGFTFSQWTGAPVADPNANPTTIEMLDNYTVTATFIVTPPGTFTLTVNVDLAQGSVVKDPDAPNYVSGVSVNITATANTGFTFSQWTGAPVADPNAAQTSIVMNDNYIVTATFTANTPPPPGGGFIISPILGGGGDTVTGNKHITSLYGMVADDGTLKFNSEASSADEFITLTLPVHTLMLTRVGNSLPFIAIETLSSPPDGVDITNIIGPTYSFTPEGATFSPPIKITFRYDGFTLPANADPENLKIVWWDSVNKKWAELECTVDTEAETVTAFISHFSLYALSLDVKPAAFAMTDLSASSTDVSKGQATQLSAIVTNTGDAAGSFTVALTVNGVKQEEKTVTLDGGSSAPVNFDLVFVKAGTYAVSLNGLSTYVSVKPDPAFFTLANLNVSPAAPKASDDINVSFQVFNSGETQGDYLIEYMIDGAVDWSETVTLAGETNREVTLTIKSLAAGAHNLVINDLLTASIEVQSAPAPQASVTAPAITPPVGTTPAASQSTTGTNTAVVWWVVGGGLLVVVVVTLLLVSRARRARR